MACLAFRVRGEKEVCETRLGPPRPRPPVVVDSNSADADGSPLQRAGRVVCVLVHGCGCGYVTAGSSAVQPTQQTEASLLSLQSKSDPFDVRSAADRDRPSDHLDLFITVIYLHFLSSSQQLKE